MKLKNLMYLLMIPALALSFTSCDSDDNDNNSNNTSIVGKWVFSGTKNSTVKTSNDSLSIALAKYFEDNQRNGHTMTFTNDSVTTMYADSISKAAYSYKKGILTVVSTEGETGESSSKSVAFNIIGSTSSAIYPMLDKFVDSEGNVIEEQIKSLISQYPEILGELEETDIAALKITEITITDEYNKSEPYN